MDIVVALLISYLLGAIPFGVIAAKICGVDIFKIGSGSTGTTNVIRACGTTWGLGVLFLDVLKGTLATNIGMLAFPHNFWLVMLCGTMAIIGHSASIFIKFRGGKSAATGAGVLLALNWPLTLIVGIVVFVLRQTTGYQSVATLAGVILAAVLFGIFAPQYFILVALGGIFVWIKHIENIKRLLAGTESKIVKKAKH